MKRNYIYKLKRTPQSQTAQFLFTLAVTLTVTALAVIEFVDYAIDQIFHY